MEINEQDMYIYVYVKNNIPKEQRFPEIEGAIDSACIDLELGEIRPAVIMDGKRNILYYYDQIVKEYKQRYGYQKIKQKNVNHMAV